MRNIQTSFVFVWRIGQTKTMCLSHLLPILLKPLKIETMPFWDKCWNMSFTWFLPSFFIFIGVFSVGEESMGWSPIFYRHFCLKSLRISLMVPLHDIWATQLGMLLSKPLGFWWIFYFYSVGLSVLFLLSSNVN